jgi:outer membrane protein assembly factor BamB
MIRRSLLTIGMIALAVVGPSAGANDHWPQFRGPSAGVAENDPALPERWSATENVVWAIDVPGVGWSSPVVWGDHVFITTVINSGQAEAPKPGLYMGGERPASTAPHKWMVHDVDFATGKVRWSRDLRNAVPGGPKHLKNSYASETPVTDGERVYVYFGSVGLFAFDMNGAPVWSKPMDAPRMRTGWGTAASPVLHNGRIYIVNDNEDRSFIAAFDARTGAQLWRTAREDERSNWSTPFVWQNEQRTEIVTTGTRKVRSYDTNGTLLWELAGMTSIHAVTPVAGHGLLFVSSGYFPDSPRPTYAIRPGARGDISLKAGETSNEFIAWSNATLASAYPSPLVLGDQYYTLMDRGFLTSNDPRTGKEVYGRQRIAADSGTFTASPWTYNGKIFAISEDGDTFVMQAGPSFKLLGRNALDEMTLASPAVANGSVFIRTATKLYRITKR